MEFVLGSLAGTAAGICTNPLEVVKTRMQLQGELKARGKHVKLYKNTMQAAYYIAKQEGILALQKGLTPFIGWQIVANGLRLGLFDVIRSSGFMTDENGKLILHRTVIIGGACGAIGGFCASPFFLIKTHMQAEPPVTSSKSQRSYSSTLNAFQTIYRKEGIRGWYRGSLTCVVRTAVGSTSQLTSFVFIKEFMKQRGILQESPLMESFIGSMVGGIAISITMAPLELVLTRLYNQETDAAGKGVLYKNFFDCVGKIWNTEGVTGFFKGMGATYIRMGPHTVLSLIFWDQFREIHDHLKKKRNK